MEVLGKKEVEQPDGRTVLANVTPWTLLGLALDHLYKVWARHGAAAVPHCEVYTKRSVRVCRLRQKGNQTWPSPGVERWFEVSDASFELALKLLHKAREGVVALNWRVFDGDVDLRTSGGKHTGSVDGVADRNGDLLSSMALVELKVRKAQAADVQAGEEASMCSGLDQRWTRFVIPRLRAPWTHGILVVCWQVSCSRAFVERDQCRVVVWSRGSPPQASLATRAAPKATAKAMAAAPRVQVRAPLAPAASLADKFSALVRSLQREGAVQQQEGEEWLALPNFLTKLGLPKKQVKRDYLEGGTCWKLGDGRGRKLAKHRDWKSIQGKRGGGRGAGLAHVRKEVLKAVYTKYYGNRQLRL